MNLPLTKLLLIEDNPADARFIHHLLADPTVTDWGSAGFELLHADRLAAAAPFLSQLDLDLIVLDLSLPDSQGLDTLRRAHAQAPNTPIVVLTGLADDATGIHALQEGAQDYLVKGRMDSRLLLRTMRYAIERHRLRAHLDDEAHLAAALARVGREIISVLDAPVLLDRLCRLTAEALECDFSQTWLWESEQRVFVAVAGYGFSAEHWESIRLIKLPRERVAPLEHADIRQVLTAESQDRLFSAVAKQYGITVTLYTALRRGRDLIGLQTSGYRGRPQPFTEQQVRLAQGIAQLASMALENARLVEELERANRIKSNFVAAMSHELRSPLNTIMGYSELLLDGTFGQMEPDQATALETVRNSAGELRDVINATLDLSRFETRRVSLELNDVAVDVLIEELATELRAETTKPHLRVLWQVVPGVPVLHTDRVKLKMILKNLVNNAIKFTERGTIRVTAREQADGVELEVADTGIGIPPEMQAAIFEPFRQADRSIGQRYGGVGLGLYIVQQLVAMLGGTVKLQSAPGRGSTFRIWVPGAVNPPADRQPALRASA